MSETTSPAQAKTSSGMAKVYLVLTILTTAVIVVQFLLAGLGAFHDVRTGDTSRFEAHERVGDVIAALSLVMLVVALLARKGGRTVGMVAGLFVMAGPIQFLLAKAGTDHSEVWGALHAFVGAGILGFCTTLIRLARMP